MLDLSDCDYGISKLFHEYQVFPANQGLLMFDIELSFLQIINLLFQAHEQVIFCVHLC